MCVETGMGVCIRNSEQGCRYCGILALTGPPFPIKLKSKFLESGVNEGEEGCKSRILYVRHFGLYVFGRADP